MTVSYGLTEAPTVVAIDERSGADHVPGASGRPLPHLAVRVAGPDGRSLPAGESGEILVGAADDRYTPMLGYWERPEATAEVALRRRAPHRRHRLPRRRTVGCTSATARA